MTTEWSATIGAAIEARRRKRGLKWASLSDVTREMGRPTHRVALGKIERGERDISVMELVGIAAALQLPPLGLLFPDIRQDVEIFPGNPVRGSDALGWFTGTGDHSQQDATGIQLALQLVTTEKTLNIQRHNLLQAERGPEVLEMSDEMRAYEAKNAERAREQIALLEAERERLMSIYTRYVAGEFDA
jgi:hypothetical protein